MQLHRQSIAGTEGEAPAWKDLGSRCDLQIEGLIAHRKTDRRLGEPKGERGELTLNPTLPQLGLPQHPRYQRCPLSLSGPNLASSASRSASAQEVA